MLQNREMFVDFLDILKRLIRHPSVVGTERPFMLMLKRELDELDIKTILYDGLLVAEGYGGTGMLSAHIDRHGLICTGPDEFQYAAFISKNRGDLTGDSISEQMFQSIVERFVGEQVHSYEPWSGAYQGIGQISRAYLCERRQSMIFSVQGLEYLTPGTPVAFTDHLSYEGGLLSAQIDNVISAAIIIYLYKIGYQGRAFFTAEEESGRSWRYLLEWFRRYDIQTDSLLVLDTSPYPTRELAETQDIVLRHKDANASFESPLKEKIENLCKESNIRFGYKDAYIEELNRARIMEGQPPGSLGSTEMGRLIHATQGGIQGTTLQLPTTGYHTTQETVLDTSVEKMIELLKKLYI